MNELSDVTLSSSGPPSWEELAKSTPMPHIQALVHMWANETFPNRPTSAAWQKLFEEIGEVLKKPEDELEWADVLILWFDLASIHKVDLATAVLKKLEINRARKWAEKNGVMTHVTD